MRYSTTVALAVALACVLGAHHVGATTVPVPGSSNPYLAGMPDGSTGTGGDLAPEESPILVTGLDLTSYNGCIVALSAQGSVTNDPDGAFVGPDGDPSVTGDHAEENGISGVIAPFNAIVGVFLGDAQPDLSAAPPALDFSAMGLGTQFVDLAPALKQVFFVGDGMTGLVGPSVDERPRIWVPAGATRLYLGTMDGHTWNNNLGSFTVEVGILDCALPVSSSTWGELKAIYR